MQPENEGLTPRGSPPFFDSPTLHFGGERPHDEGLRSNDLMAAAISYDLLALTDSYRCHIIRSFTERQ